jgi:hypothetical protein
MKSVDEHKMMKPKVPIFNWDCGAESKETNVPNNVSGKIEQKKTTPLLKK